jgi:hypothetical protein
LSFGRLGPEIARGHGHRERDDQAE